MHAYHFPTFPPPVNALGFGFNFGFESCAVRVGELCPMSANSSREMPSGFDCFFLRPASADAGVGAVEIEGPAPGTGVPAAEVSCERTLLTSAADTPPAMVVEVRGKVISSWSIVRPSRPKLSICIIPIGRSCRSLRIQAKHQTPYSVFRKHCQ